MAQWGSVGQRADRAVGVQIKWRMDGRWQSETFTDARLVAEFRAAVEAAGHRWPTRDPTAIRIGDSLWISAGERRLALERMTGIEPA
jgi:hypothetical protein